MFDRARSSLHAVAVLAAMAIAPASAGEEVLVAGPGATPCSGFNDLVPAGMGYGANVYTHDVLSWSLGFVSGVNIHRMLTERKFYDIGAITRDEFWAHIVSYCRRNPTHDIGNAANYVMGRQLPTKACSACDVARKY